MSTLRIDHVIYAVHDLEQAAATIAEDHGLASVPGGKHPAWGTENRIIPLGDEYLELVMISDPAVAAGSGFGRAVASALESGGGLVGWVVVTDDLDDVARRLGLPVEEGSRTRPDGTTLSWRLAGVSDALKTGALPFFIEWACPPDLHPGRASARHRVRPGQIAWLEVRGDEETFNGWLGDCDLPVRVTEGPPALAAVAISTEGPDIVLR
ncbi:MAG: VOC family protein [Actinomycetota bacterium]|nr:VOC family protein [Actinomycetota bacterium]